MVSDGQFLGCVTLNQVKEIPREQWPQRQVRELVRPCSNGNAIDADAGAIDVLSRMSKGQVSRLMVVKHNHLLGVISLKDMLKFLSLKIELETVGGK